MKKIWEWILSLFGGGVPAFKKFADPNKPFMGYMTVNNWSSKDPAKALGLLVEYEVPCAPFEFFENPLAYADTNVKKRLDKFEKWIIEAKKRKINLYVTLYNCNLGNPKTGHPEITGPKCDAQIMAAANQLAKWMKKYSFIYLTPCGEGGIQSKFAAYDTKIQRWCKENMPTAQLVNNWGARPLTKDGMGQLCQHPSKCGPPSIRGGSCARLLRGDRRCHRRGGAVPDRAGASGGVRDPLRQSRHPRPARRGTAREGDPGQGSGGGHLREPSPS